VHNFTWGVLAPIGECPCARVVQNRICQYREDFAGSRPGQVRFGKTGSGIFPSRQGIAGYGSSLDKDATVLSESDRIKRQRELSDLDKDLQRKQREFREDLNQRRNEELAAVVDRTNKVIKQIAEAEKYDIVFQEAVYASPRIDITDKVLKALNNGK
jgi:hypothetical protein